MNDRLFIIPALRFDGSDTFESAWSPKLGATYKLKANSRLKANVGYGFKTLTPTELYHDWQMYPGWYFEGNPNLKPEKSKSFEFGWEGERGFLSGKISYFHNKVTDLIDSYNTGEKHGADYIYTYRNIDQATLEGVETEIGRKINDKITLKVNYTYLEAIDESTGQRLTKRPRNQSVIKINLFNYKDAIFGSMERYTAPV